jgi:flagellar basal-body rod protein FlgB
MFVQDTFRQSIDVLQRAMGVSSLRREVIADNLANSDTPNFKRRTVNFETMLKRALESEKIQAFPAAMNDDRHIPFHRPIDYRTVAPRTTLDYLSSSKNNGNNVDVEQEMMNSMHNQLMYTLMAQTVNHHFNQINLVLR